MSVSKSHCPHISIIGDYTKEDIIAKQNSVCNTCGDNGPHLWVCLHRNCLYVGCNETAFNHCIKHYERQTVHSLFLNLTLLRVYCLRCDCEVFLENNDPPIPGMLTNDVLICKSDSDSDDDLYINEESMKPRGLTGLQNLGNTCYMNAAIQALSNCPQLTNFFLDCGPLVLSEVKPLLSKSYARLMKEMWHKKRPSYVVPSGIAYGIKLACPVFRGYSQQDAQEFLRCFMDQLHEEMKEPIIEFYNSSPMSPDTHECYDNIRVDSGLTQSEESSQSDVDYETCDSSIFSSERGSYIDEGIETPDHNEFSELPSAASLQSVSSSSDNIHFEVHGSLGYCQESDSQRENCETIAISISDNKSFDKNKYLKIKSVDSQEYDRNSISDIFPITKCAKSMISSRIKENKMISFKSNSFPKSLPGPSLIRPVFNVNKPQLYRSIISDIFDGQILSSVQCLTCDTISTTKETFQDLSLPIPSRDHLHLLHAAQGNQHRISGTCTDVYSHQGWFSGLFRWILYWLWGPTVSLEDCLAAFFSADELKGDNMYSCGKCGKLRNGIKFSRVFELPEMLCIHLKRFRHEVVFSSKIGNHVSFPLEGLDLSPFVHKNHLHGVTLYDLSSVICHRGTAGTGHYTSYCLNYLNEQWYEFDDQYVTAVDSETVRHCEAYVLFYRKSGEEMIKKRHCAVKLMERCHTEHGLLKFRISKQWINKFNHFADPGPITNNDFLCIHGGVPPQKAAYAEELCTILTQSVWEYLIDTFQGGPPCTHLYVCSLCQTELDNLIQRREKELSDFRLMNIESENIDKSQSLYALSMKWFKLWENFVCKERELPGPINNNNICYFINNQAFLKLGSDYCSVSENIYNYLQNIYGGGPDIILYSNPKVTKNKIGRLQDFGKPLNHNINLSILCKNDKAYDKESINAGNESNNIYADAKNAFDRVSDNVTLSLQDINI